MSLIAHYLMNNIFLQTVGIFFEVWFTYPTALGMEILCSKFYPFSEELVCYNQRDIILTCAAITFASGILTFMVWLVSEREKKRYNESREMAISLQKEQDIVKKLSMTLSQQAKKCEEEIGILQNDLAMLDEYAINLEEIKIPSLCRNLEAENQKVKNLELKAQKQAVNHEVDILASKEAIEVLEKHNKYLHQTKLNLQELNMERLKNKLIKIEHMERKAKYEEEMGTLIRRAEIQEKYILKLESAVFQMKENVKRVCIAIYNYQYSRYIKISVH
ncbi:hypothetical protein RUND412_006037 [Rhizina undulata]